MSGVWTGAHLGNALLFRGPFIRIRVLRVICAITFHNPGILVDESVLSLGSCLVVSCMELTSTPNPGLVGRQWPSDTGVLVLPTHTHKRTVSARRQQGMGRASLGQPRQAAPSRAMPRHAAPSLAKPLQYIPRRAY